MKAKSLKPINHIFVPLSLFILIGSCRVSQHAASTSYPIAYTSLASNNKDIYITNPTGKSKIKLTNFAGGNGYSAWSPDGKRIAFYAKYDNKRTWSIHTINVDGTNRKRLTHANGKWDSSPAWSPDGKKIVFARTYRDANKVVQHQIWMMNTDGSAQTQIKSLSGGGPCFTPDGRIVFHSEYPGKKSNISIADIDGDNLTHLTHTEAEEWQPEVSPDGKQIAFTSKRDGNFEIYVMDIDGSNQKRLTFNKFRDSMPSWSPDGTQLIFTSRRDDIIDIYMMRQDGSSIKKIIPQGGQPAWFKATH